MRRYRDEWRNSGHPLFTGNLCGRHLGGQSVTNLAFYQYRDELTYRRARELLVNPPPWPVAACLWLSPSADGFVSPPLLYSVGS